MIVATSHQMKEIDRISIEDYHIPGILLMEHAAIKVLEALESFDKNLPLCVVCGVGNNGGDGLAVARLAFMNGRDILVVMVGDLRKQTEDGKVMLRAILSLDIPVVYITASSDLEAINGSLKYLVVDALFGIGCTRPVEGYCREIVQWMNTVNESLISIDLPSGIHSDTGQALGTAVHADLTVSFTLPKLGNIMGAGRLSCGELRIVDIGIPKSVLEKFDYNYELIDEDILRFIPIRALQGHKMTFGRLLIVAGSRTMAGAAILASRAAYRSGAGLVEVMTHSNGVTALQKALPEAIIHSYANDQEGHVILETLTGRMDSYDGILIGPGISTGTFSTTVLKSFLEKGQCPMVIDADGLNLLSEHVHLLDSYGYPIVLTPHIGEMSRLTGYDKADILRAPFEIANSYCQIHGVIIVLKSDRTIVADGSGHFYINVLGNNGMATAGSGDVLAGIILALIGQGTEFHLASVLGVGIHSLAGDLAASDLGEHSMMATDIIEALQYVLKNRDK